LYALDRLPSVVLPRYAMSERRHNLPASVSMRAHTFQRPPTMALVPTLQLAGVMGTVVGALRRVRPQRVAIAWAICRGSDADVLGVEGGGAPTTGGEDTGAGAFCQISRGLAGRFLQNYSSSIPSLWISIQRL
jgi:hypothetical protein